MKNASHTYGSCACAVTRSAACLTSSKEENPRGGPLYVYPGLGQCFQVHIHLYMPCSHHSLTHTHHLHSSLFPYWRTLSLRVVLAEGEQQWCGTGLFFSAGQTLARPEGGSHPIPPEVPLVWDPVWKSTCWENLTLDTFFKASLNISVGGGDILFKSTAPDQSAFCTELWGWPRFLDHVEWRWSALTHVVRHMDGEERNTFFSLHLLEYLG